MISYPMLIKKDDDGNITLWFPDLRKFVAIPENCDDIVKDAMRALSKHLIYLEKNNFAVPEPRKLEDLQAIIHRGKNDIWTEIFISNYDIKKGFFQKAFPGLGIVAKFIGTICTALVTYLAMQLTTGSNLSSKIASGIGAMLELFFVLIIYLYSSTSDDLARLGRRVDNYLFRNQDPKAQQQAINEIALTKTSCHSSTTSKIFSLLGLNILVSVSTAITLNTLYQEVESVGARARSTDTFITPELILILAIVSIISNGLSAYPFQISFAKAMLDDLCAKYNNKPKRQEIEEVRERAPLLVNTVIDIGPAEIEESNRNETEENRTSPRPVLTSPVLLPI